jgi:hypothetical protein
MYNSCPKCNRISIIYPQKKYSLMKGSKIKSKSKVRIPLRAGLLRKYGYSVKNPQKLREKSLASAVGEYGALSVFRKLNALMILNMNKDPYMSNMYKKDRNWVRKKFM